MTKWSKWEMLRNYLKAEGEKRDNGMISITGTLRVMNSLDAQERAYTEAKMKGCKI